MELRRKRVEALDEGEEYGAFQPHIQLTSPRTFGNIISNATWGCHNWISLDQQFVPNDNDKFNQAPEVLEFCDPTVALGPTRRTASTKTRHFEDVQQDDGTARGITDIEEERQIDISSVFEN